MGLPFLDLNLSWAAILIALLLCLIAYIKYAFSYWNRIGVKTLPPKFPFGSLTSAFKGETSFGQVFQNIYDTLKKQGEEFAGAYFFLSPVFIPISNAQVKHILQADFGHFAERGFYVNEEHDPLSGNLFNLGYEKWKILRSKLTPTFTSGKIKMMFHTITDCAEDLEEVLHSLVEDNKPINVGDVASRFNTDVIGSCAFGIKCDSLKNPDAEFLHYGKKSFEPNIRGVCVFALPHSFLKMIRLNTWPSEVSNFFVNSIKKTVEFREKNNIYRNDFVDLLLQLKNKGYVASDEKHQINLDKGDEAPKDKLTMNELSAQCFVFFNAGFETSSTTTTFALFELAVNQDIQDQVREEINAVLDKHGGKLTYESISEMKYLENVICETLRKHPPLAFLNRLCTKDYNIPGTSKVIKKNTMTIVPVLGIHRDPEYYPNPEEFQPERFNEENKKIRPPYTWLPFGEGPRICIGLRFGMLQVKAGLVTVLKKYKVTLNEKTKIPLEYDPVTFITTPKGGIWLNITEV